MAQPQPDQAGVLSTQRGHTRRRTGRSVATTVLAVVGIIALVGLVAVEGSALWNEWALLQGEVSEAQRHRVIGFYDIAPIATYAGAPSEFYRREGDSSLLWSRWESGVGHKWFRFMNGEIDPGRIARPTAHFITRAIDYPVVETGGGTIWSRIPPDSGVVGHTLEGTKCVYPVVLLGKVEVVNDIVADHPYLVVVNLFETAGRAVSIFDARVGEHRVTMAATGYFLDRKPLLYDRGSESLWVENTDGLAAIAGKQKDAKLHRVASLHPMSWSEWLSRNRDSRLVVGADRSRGVPNE
jgi:Protein of unknown function (DUF3179)